MDPLAEIKRLYYSASRTTIRRDLAQAIALLKTMPTEDQRERAAVFMDGLAQLNAEWSTESRSAGPKPKPGALKPKA